MSGSLEKWENRGDLAFKVRTKKERQKIYVDDRRELAVSMAGTFDGHYINFLMNLLGGRINFQTAITKKIFEEFRALNISRWGYTAPETDDMNILLAATNYSGVPRLYRCYPLGKVEEVDFDALGSGSKFANKHITDSGKLIPNYITLRESVDLAIASLDKAQEDIYTTGLNMTLVLPGRIIEFGEEINSAIKKARDESVLRMKEKLV